jgi:hypothetical protein
LLFEGRSLTELLARVRAEHGEDVRIVAADRQRTGGVAGFFARETYAVTVELDDAPTPQPLPELTETIEAIEAAERAQTAMVLTTPPLSTSGPQFATVLEKLRALDEEPPAPKSTPAPIGVDADTWAQLVNVLSTAGVTVVVLAPTPAPVVEDEPVDVVTLPRQGRHRRALV